MEKLFEETVVEIELDLDKRFQFPTKLVVKKFEDKNLVIYTEGVLWLVFTDEEMLVYNFFSSGGSISEALQNYEESIVISVISQIEAKRFENPIVREFEEKNIYIYLTNNCNERCKHCYMYAGDIKVQELSPDIWIKLLKEYKQHGGNGVTFTGGEVTVYNGFKDILKGAHDLGLVVTVLTNGTLWNEADIQECAQFIDEIQISIDGYDSESYYAVRQFDGFNRAIKTMLSFNSYGTRTSMAVTPLYDNLDEFILKFEPFAKNILKKYPNIYIRFNLELLDGRSVKKDTNKNLEYRKKVRALVERLYPNFYLETFSLNYNGHIIRKNCGFGEIAIAANGDIYWCNRIHELSSKWNILTTDFQQIMNYSNDIKIKTDVDHSITCKKCEVRYICGGDCRMNYKGIKLVDNHRGMWKNTCPKGYKEMLFRKMILCNDYFFESLDEE